jgi:PAS domain S-box-containing protein
MESEPDRQIILVIDDAPDVLLLMTNILKDHYNVRVANRGDTGLRLASTYPLPSLILLDIIMPGLDGYEVINVLKSDPVTAAIPVIFLTGRTEESDQEKGLLFGAVDYIVKPISPTVLLARVRNHLVIHAYRNFLKDKNAYLEDEVRRRAKEMMESEQRLRHFVMNTPLGVIELDTYFRVMAWNKSSERIFGYSRLEVLGLDIADLLLKNYNISTADQIRDFFLERKGEFITLENVTKEGLRIICEWYNTPLTDVKGNFVGVMSLVNDITRRTRAEQERENLARAIENLVEMVIITDSDGLIMYVNPAFTRITGYSNEEVCGRNPNILKSSHQDNNFYKKMWETIRGGENWKGRLVNKKKDGSLYEEESTIAPSRMKPV